MAATGEVVRAREAQVEGAVADVEALKVAGTVAVGLARAVAVEMARGMVVGVATSWAWAEPGLSGAGPSEIPSTTKRPPARPHCTPIRHLLVVTRKRLNTQVHACIASKRVVSLHAHTIDATSDRRQALRRAWYRYIVGWTREYGVKCRTWSMTTVGRSSAAANSSTATASARTLWI